MLSDELKIELRHFVHDLQAFLWSCRVNEHHKVRSTIYPPGETRQAVHRLSHFRPRLSVVAETLTARDAPRRLSGRLLTWRLPRRYPEGPIVATVVLVRNAASRMRNWFTVLRCLGANSMVAPAWCQR
jgi:hypothetical protein